MSKQITFETLVRVLMSVEPGEDMEFLKREFMEVVKGLICLPVKLPGFRMYKSLQVINLIYNKHKQDNVESQWIVA